MLRNKLIAILTLFFFTFMTATAFAEEEPVITSVEEGEPAPFDGVLFNNTAAAEIMAMKERLKEEFLLMLEEQREKDKAHYEYMLKNSQDLLEIVEEENRKLLEIKDEQIHELEKLVLEDEEDLDYLWWGLGGLGLGALLATGITLVVVSAQ